jgi:hypothetical protein
MRLECDTNALVSRENLPWAQPIVLTPSLLSQVTKAALAMLDDFGR